MWHEERRVKTKVSIQPKSIMNEVATGDIFPVLAANLTWGYGSPGTHGFRNNYVEDRWNSGGHSTVLARQHCSKIWIPFLKTGEVVESSEKPTTIWVKLFERPYRNLFLLVVLFYLLRFATISYIWPVLFP